jgi:hypothetical protein
MLSQQSKRSVLRLACFFFSSRPVTTTANAPSAFWVVAVVGESKEEGENRARDLIKSRGYEVVSRDGDFIMDEQRAAEKPEFLELYQQAQQNGIAAFLHEGPPS